MNKVLGIIIAIVIIVGGVYLIVKASNKHSTTTGDTATTDTGGAASGSTTTGPQGHVVFAVSDPSTSMSGISEINLDVSKVELHSATAGWITVSDASHTYGLLGLNSSGQAELLADIQAPVDTYDQARLTIDSASVTRDDGSIKQAKVPGKVLGTSTMLVVDANTTSSMNFDFMASKSLFTASNGDYVFAPVVRAQATSGDNVIVDANNMVTTTGGHVDNTTTVGMDLDGAVKANFIIPVSTVIDSSTVGVTTVNANSAANLNATLK